MHFLIMIAHIKSKVFPLTLTTPSSFKYPTSQFLKAPLLRFALVALQLSMLHFNIPVIVEALKNLYQNPDGAKKLDRS